MPEPFKNMVREERIRELGERLAAAGAFDVEAFVVEAAAGLEALELKQRVRQVSDVLRRHLDPDYSRAVAHLLTALPPPLAGTEGVTAGVLLWPLCQLVEDYGVDDPETSLPALRELTRRFSAEFAIRPFLIRYPETTFAALAEWLKDPDPHVRRLVSEGTRTRLPWGQRLPHVMANPSPVLPLLEALRDDPEEYVRRSVANNLNDLSKDHPDLVVEVCGRWLDGAPKKRRELVRHALRSLVKQGHPGALELLGAGPPEIEVVGFRCPPEAAIGDAVPLALELRSTADREQKLVIDYALHFPGAGGRTNRKVFKWATTTVAPRDTFFSQRHHGFQPVTTRTTRPGAHRFELLVNGRSLASCELELRR